MAFWLRELGLSVPTPRYPELRDNKLTSSEAEEDEDSAEVKIVEMKEKKSESQMELSDIRWLDVFRYPKLYTKYVFRIVCLQFHKYRDLPYPFEGIFEKTDGKRNLSMPEVVEYTPDNILKDIEEAFVEWITPVIKRSIEVRDLKLHNAYRHGLPASNNPLVTLDDVSKAFVDLGYVKDWTMDDGMKNCNWLLLTVQIEN